MNRYRSRFVFVLLFMLFAVSAQARDGGMLSLGIGVFDVDGSADATDFRLEYRYGTSFLLDNLKPWAGIEVTSDSSVWVGGGLLYDWALGNQWHLVPSIGVGLYDRGSSALDLGHVIEFRSQLELAYAFTNQHRLALAISHLSNAGLDNENPGTEVVTLYWQLPF